MAGPTLALSRAGVAAGQRVVRAMPNTPAAIGRGITVAVAERAGVARRSASSCIALLSAIGAVEWVEDEALIDAVTAVSGSGPAYVFLLAEAMARGRRRRRAAGRSGGAARARDGRGLRRAAASLAARSGDAAAERHLAGRDHGRRARGADGGGRPRPADDRGDRRRHPALARTGGVTLRRIRRADTRPAPLEPPLLPA